MPLNATSARAHDPSAWGGLFRSRDAGATWFPASERRFVTAAVDVAVDPVDPNQLLLATDVGMLRSVNGGRDWSDVGQAIIRGVVLAVGYAADGRFALAATTSGLFASDDGGDNWRTVDLGPAPPWISSILVPRGSDRVYLVGAHAILSSGDHGETWTDVRGGLPEGRVQGLALLPGPGDEEQLYALVDGRLFATSTRGGRGWRPLAPAVGSGPLDFVAADPRAIGRLWTASQGTLYRTDDGVAWSRVAAPLEPASSAIRGLAIAPDDQAVLVVSSDHGLFRSVDGGSSWENLQSNLPAHLEAGPLVIDPTDPRTLYAGYSVTPFAELRGSGASVGSTLLRLGAGNLGGGAAFLVLLGGSAWLLLRRLAPYYRQPEPPAIPAPARGTPERGQFGA